MNKYKHKVNTEIAITHIVSRKKQTIITALGVMIGVGMFIFMNSLMNGFDRYSTEVLFKTTPHIRIFKDDMTSKPLLASLDDKDLSIIINPKITNESKKIINPYQVMETVKTNPEVVEAGPYVSANVFYNNGQSQINGLASGVNILEHDIMFDLSSNMVDGKIENLKNQQDGIIIGEGIAQKLSVRSGDNITVTSALGTVKIFQVVGIFSSGNAKTDESKSYINIAMAQQLMQESSSYVTDIYVKLKDHTKTIEYSDDLKRLSTYNVETWQDASSSAVAGNKVRTIMGMAISAAILLVAGFGIYNILNMTIMEKMQDIAILKAMGFKGKDVIRIFIYQAMSIGFIGVGLGMTMAAILVQILGRTWVGGDIGYFPIQFEPYYFALGVTFGLLITFLAGIIPSRKAAKVDPVAIFRK